MLISFLNDVDIQLILEFKKVLENITQSFLKIFKIFFLGHPVCIKLIILTNLILKHTFQNNVKFEKDTVSENIIATTKYEIIMCYPIIQISNIALAILGFSLLLLVQLSLLILF